MSDFVKNGEFSAERVQLPRKKRNLIIVISWNIVLAMPILYALYSLLRSSLLVSVPTMAVCLLIGTLKITDENIQMNTRTPENKHNHTVSIVGYIVLRVLLNFSDTKKGSKFGLKQNGTKEPLRDEKNGTHRVNKID